VLAGIVTLLLLLLLFETVGVPAPPTFAVSATSSGISSLLGFKLCANFKKAS
jgi:hypothetical protein